MPDLLAAIKKRVLISDGAMGTELDRRGMPPGACRELWNIQRPEVVRTIHLEYLRAGAEVLLTNTFGGNRWALARHNLADQVEPLNRAGVRLAREAADSADTGEVFILGDIGPTGELPQPYGTRPLGEFEEVFAEQAAALAAETSPRGQPVIAGILVETMTAIEEAAAAVRAAKNSTDLPVLATMAFDFNPARGTFFTPMGVPLEQMSKTLEEAGADLIGANCGSVDIVRMARLIEELAQLTDLPIIVQINAGLPRLEGGRTRYDQTPEDFAAGGPPLVAAGARIVGGCCGTTPEHIAALREAIAHAAP